MDQYRAFLAAMGTDSLVLPNCDFASGKLTRAAEYSLTDETYAKLLARLSERKFDLTSPELRTNLVEFYSDLSVPISTKTNPGDWQHLLTELDQLKSMTLVTAAAHESAP